MRINFVVLVELLDNYSSAVRNFVREGAQELFTDYFSGDLSLRLVCQTVLVKHPLALVKELFRLVKHVAHILSGFGTGRNNGVKIVESGVVCYGFGELFTVHEVYLVQHKD